MMKIGDLVRMKNDDVLGVIAEINTSAEPSLGPCWYVFWFAYSRSIPAWETELEVVSVA
jgi:hypothetical protein